MKNKKFIVIYLLLSTTLILFSKCSDIGKNKDTSQKPNFGGFDSQIKWGEHLATVGGCGDCHTPKKMTPKGPEPDNSLMFSGHPAQMPPPDIDRKEIEKKGLAVTQTLTAWVGPWGISYAANLTPDATGIGGWTESSFITALREGKYKGLPSGRALLPPMPWEFFKSMSDDEIKAMFAYFKSVKPINNLVPQAAPPLSAGQK